MRFSKPDWSACENGKLSGSAHTLNCVLSTKLGARPSESATLRQRKDMQHAAFHGVLRQVAHRVDEAERGRSVARIDLSGDDRAGPAANAGEHRDVLLAIRAAVAYGLADDAGARAEAPQHLARVRIERLEDAVHRAVEDDAARGGERAAPHREVLLHRPALLRRDGVPGAEFAAMAARAGLHPDLRADVRRAGDVARLVGARVLTEIGRASCR